METDAGPRSPRQPQPRAPDSCSRAPPQITRFSRYHLWYWALNGAAGAACVWLARRSVVVVGGLRHDQWKGAMSARPTRATSAADLARLLLPAWHPASPQHARRPPSAAAAAVADCPRKAHACSSPQENLPLQHTEETSLQRVQGAHLRLTGGPCFRGPRAARVPAAGRRGPPARAAAAASLLLLLRLLRHSSGCHELVELWGLGEDDLHVSLLHRSVPTLPLLGVQARRDLCAHAHPTHALPSRHLHHHAPLSQHAC